MTKTALLKQLKTNQEIQDAWVDSLPVDLRMAFVDNPMMDAMYKNQELLLREAMGGTYADAEYFLNEWKPGYSITEADGIEWSFSSASEFYVYFRKVCGE